MNCIVCFRHTDEYTDVELINSVMVAMCHECMSRIEPERQDMTTEPPLDEWYILLYEDKLSLRYDVYLLLDTPDERFAFDGQEFREVAEGVDPPKWSTVSRQSLENKHSFIKAFKHVYMVKQELVPYV